MTARVIDNRLAICYRGATSDPARESAEISGTGYARPMCRNIIPVQAMVLVLLLSLPGEAVDRLVPYQYKTIQAAIDASLPFDRVLVAAGTYRERIAFRGIPLLVESEWGASVTVIDGGGQGPVVQFDPRDGQYVCLKGFTVTGGRVEADDARGGGIYCPGGSPLLLDNIVTGNEVRGHRSSQGGGLYTTGSPTVYGNEFSDNTATGLERATDHAGGGIYATGGLFYENRVIGNSLFSGREIWDKVARSRGAGAALIGKVIFLRNEVAGNNACFFGQEARGGGLALEGGPVVALNLVRTNTARAVLARGGGIYCAPGCVARLEGNAIVENFAQSDDKNEGQGGGVYVDSGAAPVLAYDTIHANRVAGVKGSGGGVMVNGSTPWIVGCLFWKNSFWENGGDVRMTSIDGVAVAQVSHSLIGDGQFAGVRANFQADPELVDAYRLSAVSPCIDRGEPGAESLTIRLDLDGATRPMDGLGDGQARVDVGAHEFSFLRRAGRCPVVSGHTVPLVLAVPGLPGRSYLCAASLGNAGIPLPPPDPRVLPLSLDFLFMLSLGQRSAPFKDFGGVLDSTGAAHPELEVPASPVLAGVTVHVAGLVLDGTAIRVVTNGVAIGVQR